MSINVGERISINVGERIVNRVIKCWRENHQSSDNVEHYERFKNDHGLSDIFVISFESLSDWCIFELRVYVCN